MDSVYPDLIYGTLMERLGNQVQVASPDRSTDYVKHFFNMSSYSTDQNYKFISELLARMWWIGIDTTKKALEEKMQHGARKSVRPLTRRFWMDTISPNHRQMSMNVYSDKMFYDVKSLRLNIYVHIFTTDSLVQLYPIKDKYNPNLVNYCQYISEDVSTHNLMVVDNTT